MDELLHTLENKIKELVHRYDNLKETHSELQNGTSYLSGERKALLERQQQAISQIETLVSRLKAIEDLP